jgi:acetamidase/formamidase
MRRLWHSAIDRQRGVATLPWGTELKLAPFFGVMGTAPPPEYGLQSSIEPREYGGNMDLKELVAGTTLYLPVFVEGGRFSVGDGHGAQGDGEVCLTALETALTGTFRLILRKDLAFKLPRAETATHWITLGFDPDLDDAAKIALREMIQLVVAATGLAAEEAYMLCSVACDLRVTQLVDGNKGIHAMLAKSLLVRR